jgi:2-polyprenyl-3-methyl-5-hydroxy-6-metoxy-1,4-benzoquinol methylase
MENTGRHEHWENIYKSKDTSELSWYQSTPETSLDFFRQFNVPKSAKIIDIGGGDSLLVDHLLDLEYQDITILDISETALEKAKSRLGKRADKVKWIVADASKFKADEKYDFWHDRAAFHFLTEEADIKSYIENAQKNINPNGIMVIGTFSEAGPKKCSGIEIKQYSEGSMNNMLGKFFEKIKCVNVEHKTPSGSLQSFVFCSFRKPSS